MSVFPNYCLKTGLILFLPLLSIGQTPTWARDIAPILYENCTNCHHPGGLAPFSLVGYENAFHFRLAVEAAVTTGDMPPWPPDPDYVELAYARILEPAEIEAIQDWIAEGAPAGDMSEAPVPPSYEQEEVIDQPDLVLSIPSYISQADEEDIYRCFPISTGLGQDWTIKALECLPGNQEIVHHVLIYLDESDQTLQLDAADPGPGYTSFGGVGSNSAKLISAWAPGGHPLIFPEGMGRRLPAGATIILQIHYPAGTKGKTDQTRLNLQLSAEPAREVFFEPVINHFETLTNGPLFIPANTVKTFNARFFVPIKVTVIGVAPHMHLLGRQIKAFAVNPQQETIPLIKIDDWDFHWHSLYYYTRPVILPAGTVIYSDATYDNTVNNPENPNNPPRDVREGEATTDEMYLIYAAFLFYQNGDENIVLANSDPTTAMSEAKPLPRVPLRVHPNPSRTQIDLRFDLPQSQRISIHLFDASGRKVKTLHRGSFASGPQRLRLSASGQAAGTYYLCLQAPAYYGVTKLTIVN